MLVGVCFCLETDVLYNQIGLTPAIAFLFCSCQHFRAGSFFADDGTKVFEVSHLLLLLSTHSDIGLDGFSVVDHEIYFL